MICQFSLFSRDWYLPQGPSDCGPASVAMAIKFQSGRINVPVNRVRKYIGNPYPEGATSFDNLKGALRFFGAKYRTVDLSSITKIDSLLKKDSVIIVLIHPFKISMGLNERYYNYAEDNKFSHYIVLKGSIEKNLYDLEELPNNYYIVHDPIPGGRNRYYRKTELYLSLRTHLGIEVFKGIE